MRREPEIHHLRSDRGHLSSSTSQITTSSNIPLLFITESCATRGEGGGVLMPAINDSKAERNISSYPSVPVSGIFRGSWWMRALLVRSESTAADGAALPSHWCSWRGGRGVSLPSPLHATVSTQRSLATIVPTETSRRSW